MLRHTLDPLFQPDSLLVVSDQPLPVYQSLPPSLRARTTRVDVQQGQLARLPQRLEGLKPDERLDLAVVCMPPLLLVDTLAELSQIRPRALIVMAHEVIDPDPQRTRQACDAWAKAHECALLGPFSFGLQRPHLGLNLSQHPLLARPGRAALVAQSRTVMAGVMDWADDAYIGFSTAIALADGGVTRLSDVLDYLASDPRTDSIALYLEDVGSGREFMSALRSAASIKPVVVLKSGAANESLSADLAFDAALRRTGAVRVRYFIQLFSAIKVFGYSRRPRGRRVAVFANGQGPAQLALDLAAEGGPIVQATLSPGTRRRLGKVLEPGSMALNPVVTHQPLSNALVQEVLTTLLRDEGVDGLLVMLAPDPRSDFKAASVELANIATTATKPVVTCFMGDAGMRPIRRTLDQAGASAFRTPESAANAFGILASYHYNQQLLQQIQPTEPEHPVPERARARARLRKVLDQGQNTVPSDQAWAVLMDFHVPIGSPDALGTQPLTVQDYPSAISVERDEKFGPVIRFGAGGILARFAQAQAGADLAPLNYFLAKRMVQRSQFWQRLPPDSLSAELLTQLLVALELISDLVSECPEVLSLRLDPIVVRNNQLVAGEITMTLDAAASPEDAATSGYAHMAVHPYPRQWVQKLRLDDQHPCLVRPIRPDDGQALQAFMRSLSEQARYMRFVSMMRELTPSMLFRYTQVDYHRELALVATLMDQGQESIIGLAHYLRNPDGEGAEYALVIADQWQGFGLGRQLMRRLIEAARQQGLAYMEGLVLSNNRPMIGLMTSLGMINDPYPQDSSMRRIWLQLSPAQ
jgi:acetyltransferase